MQRKVIAGKLEKIQPRGWQEEGVDKCLDLLRAKRIAVVESVTGGGKTFFACIVAARMAVAEQVDEIVVLCPSVGIKEAWADTFQAVGINCTSRAYKTDGADAIAVTYVGAANRDVDEKLARKKKRLLIVDEFHHAERDRTWGDAVSRCASKSTCVLMLSGTPWRSEGQIALLKDFGYYSNGHVEADIVYRYAEDLAKTGNDRATVYAEFVFFESKAFNPDTNKSISWDAPTEGELENFADEKDNSPLGIHVQIADALLSQNRMAKSMLEFGVNKLEQALRETKNRAIGLVVTRNISEARCVCTYLTDVLDQRAEVIVSDDDNAADRICQIKKEDRSRSPDWIVSVGMVSEGVDIPQIKVVVYLSAITTLLYLVQVIGRALRRINIGTPIEPQYIDRYPGQTPGYILMPAHPFLIWLASKFEDDKRQAEKQRKPGGEGGDGPGPQPLAVWANDGGDNAGSVFGGQLQQMHLQQMLDLLACDCDAKSIVTETYYATIKEWMHAGMLDHVEEELSRLCKRFKIQIPEKQTFSEQLSYDTRISIASKEAKRLTTMIRFRHKDFKDRPKTEDQSTYAEIRGIINKHCGISSFESAAVEKKEQWVALATKMLEGCK